ncbi:hypothetical protein EMIT047CA2_290002 [Pseudomonas soli]
MAGTGDFRALVKVPDFLQLRRQGRKAKAEFGDKKMALNNGHSPCPLSRQSSQGAWFLTNVTATVPAIMALGTLRTLPGTP